MYVCVYKCCGVVIYNIGVRPGRPGGGARRKGPAPGLPLPARRAVHAPLPPAALQAQLELLDAQQLGLERQGVLIEQMIRDKCEGLPNITIIEIHCGRGTTVDVIIRITYED